MTDRDELLAAVAADLRRRSRIDSIEELWAKLDKLSIGIPQSIPVAFRDTRLFRVRRVDDKPTTIEQIGVPPSRVAPIGRLNRTGQPVLYLADSPDTAFAEARAGAGYFCLSEWRTTPEKLAMANGGLSSEMVAEQFTRNIYEGAEPLPQPSEQDQRVLAFFRESTRSMSERKTSCIGGLSHAAW